jgi:uncharacterized protein YdeI (BOF family)
VRRSLLVVTAAALLSLGAVACDGTANDNAAATGGAQATTTVEPTAGATTNEQVTVEGTVSQVLTDRAFLLTDPNVETGPALAGDRIPVIVTGTTTDVNRNDEVVVSGTLHQADVQDEIGRLGDQLGISIDPTVVQAISGRELLVADSVRATTP